MGFGLEALKERSVVNARSIDGRRWLTYDGAVGLSTRKAKDNKRLPLSSVQINRVFLNL